MSDGTHSLRRLRGFARDNSEIEFRQFRRIMRCIEIGVKFVSSGNSQAALVETFGMLRPTNKGPYLSNFGQVRSVQASDRTATDDADSFDQIVPARNAFYVPARGCSTRTIEANPPEPARCSARKIESPVLCESSIITPLE